MSHKGLYLSIIFLSLFAISYGQDCSKEYYASGFIKGEGQCTDNVKNGEWIYYFEGAGESKKKQYYESKGSYKNGEKDGVWINYYNNFYYSIGNPPKSAGFYENGKKNGEWATYYDNPDSNKIVESVGYYKDDLKTGQWRYYTEDGNEQSDIYMIEEYENGKLHGHIYEYDENGNVISNERYHNGLFRSLKMIVDDEFFIYIDSTYYMKEYYFENGKTTSIHTEGKVDNDLFRIGEWKSYYEDGQLKSVATYVNSNIHGDYVTYHPNGRKSEEGEVEHGKYNGEWRTYYKTGDLNQFMNFENDQLNGVYRQFYLSGKLAIEGKFENGLEIGQWNHYYENGNLKEVYTMEIVAGKSRKTDQWYKFYSDGSVEKIMKIKYGFPDSSKEFKRGKKFIKL